MPSEQEMKKKLKEEIDRMKMTDLENYYRNKNSFMTWVKNTVKRIWDIVADKVVKKVAEWLWGAIEKAFS